MPNNAPSVRSANFDFLAGHDVQLARLGALQRLPIPLAPPEEAAQVVQLIETYLEPLDRLEAEVSSASKIVSRLDNKILEQAFCGELTNMNCIGSP